MHAQQKLLSSRFWCEHLSSWSHSRNPSPIETKDIKIVRTDIDRLYRYQPGTLAALIMPRSNSRKKINLFVGCCCLCCCSMFTSWETSRMKCCKIRLRPSTLFRQFRFSFIFRIFWMWMCRIAYVRCRLWLVENKLSFAIRKVSFGRMAENTMCGKKNRFYRKHKRLLDVVCWLLLLSA